MKNKNQILEKRSLLSVLLFLFLLNYTTHGQTNWPCGVDVHGIDHFHMDCPDEGIIITSLEVDGAEGSEVQGIITSGQSIYILPGYSQVRIVPFTERLKGELSHVTTIGGTGNGGGFNQPSSQTRVDLYPNPTQSDISITVDGKQKIISYTLLGMYETSIKNKRFTKPTLQHTFSVTTIRKGIYILKLQLDNGEILTKKIIKN